MSGNRRARGCFQLGRKLPDQLPCARDMPFRGVQITDRQPERIALVELRGRQEHLPRSVEPFEQGGVELVCCTSPETDHAERDRRGALEVARSIDPAREETCETDV